MSICSMNCLECEYDRCINDSPMTHEERKFHREYETSLKKDLGPKIIPELGMQRYIRNRPDKEAYIKARDAEYESSRRGSPQRIGSSKKYYNTHRRKRIDYQLSYYEANKDEILARQKAYYEAHKDEINRKRREERRKKRNEDS